MEIELDHSWIGAVSALLFCVVVFTFDGSTGMAREISSTATGLSVSDDGDQPANRELLDASSSLDQTLEDRVDPEAGLRKRIVGLGVIGGGVLALLGVLFAYLRLDHATRGFYGGRLLLVAAIAASAILVLCYYLWVQVLSG